MELQELEDKIQSSDALLIYFSGANCNVCKALQPKLLAAFKDNYPLIEQLSLEVEQNPEISAQFGVFAVPTVIIYFDGKEVQRKARNISVDGLLQDIQRPYSLFFD